MPNPPVSALIIVQCTARRTTLRPAITLLTQRDSAIATLTEIPPGPDAPAEENLRPIPQLTETDNRILALHLAAVFLFGIGMSLSYTLPFLARKRFDAGDWQSWVLTSAVPASQFFTVFWNHFYARVPISRYLTIITICACVPIALMSLANTINPIMIGFVIAAWAGAAGGAALSPVNADMLRACYAPKVRGRIFGLVMTAQFAGVMLGGQAAGKWSDADPEAYRIYLPIIAMLLALGYFSYRVITWTARFKSRTLPVVERGTKWWTPLRDTTRVLREDHKFAAYESAFMSYGVGWMICTALLPLIGNDRLGLDYAHYSMSVIVIYQIVCIIMLPAMGRLSDKTGPVSLAAVSFLWLTLYPIALMMAVGTKSLGLATAMYAMGMTGVHLTWTLGPVAFAPEPAKAPQYLAIHGTLVGVRGLVAQGVGVGLYALTGTFWCPLILAAAGFLWAAWRMRLLGRQMERSSDPASN